ncbi:E3 ubiquitin-protein ligase COP1-like [Brevipalpus obovatus]|uniref:E3 ubiquitin-protein ligase COP1-like n=1 Tax=Brevipalpus obovatus TaxID=246614 RepID=UPI003D9EFC9B
MESSRAKRKRSDLIVNPASSDNSINGCSDNIAAAAAADADSDSVKNCALKKRVDFGCPICLETIEEATVTECGHTFCHKCISRALDSSNLCPNCNCVVDKVFPNFLLNELIIQYNRNRLAAGSDGDTAALVQWKEMISKKTDSLHLSDIDYLLQVLYDKKKEYELTSKAIQIELLREFLSQARRQKQEQLHQISTELKIIEEDSSKLDIITKQDCSSNSFGNLQASMLSSSSNGIHRLSGGTDKSSEETPINEPTSSHSTPTTSITVSEESNTREPRTKSTLFSTCLNTRRKKMRAHFDDLVGCYFNTRAKKAYLSNEDVCKDGLNDFVETLNKLTMFSTLKPLVTLCYTSDPYNSSSIVSSIEFDKDNETFAIAGVTKKIKLFEYSMVVKDTLTMHYPITEMECKSRISCVSWSSYYKSFLASSDYEGTVTIWDVYTHKQIKNYNEHEKRCWSVDFNKVDTNLVSSASDDGKVKLWSLNMENSVASLEAKANVCCVKFNPMTRYHIAFGSADHCLYYYDLRNIKQPQSIFKGHRKAVSYVRFLNRNEIVSASTDSQLKMWNTNKSHCQRSFKGHTNEKHFVGLATDGDYIACGSENNSLFMYYKGLSKPAMNFAFDTGKTLSHSQEREKKDNDTNDFVSAICWKSGSNIIVAANSQGVIKILELV